MRILVVEDERLLCDGIAEDLRLEKYTVDCCYDGPVQISSSMAASLSPQFLASCS